MSLIGSCSSGGSSKYDDDLKSGIEKYYNGLTQVIIKKDYLLTYQNELEKGIFHLTQSSEPDKSTLNYNTLNEKEVTKIDSDINLEPTNDYILRTWG